MAIGVPGWPELAVCTASIASVRIVLTLRASRSVPKSSSLRRGSGVCKAKLGRAKRPGTGEIAGATRAAKSHRGSDRCGCSGPSENTITPSGASGTVALVRTPLRVGPLARSGVQTGPAADCDRLADGQAGETGGRRSRRSAGGGRDDGRPRHRLDRRRVPPRAGVTRPWAPLRRDLAPNGGGRAPAWPSRGVLRPVRAPRHRRRRRRPGRADRLARQGRRGRAHSRKDRRRGGRPVRRHRLRRQARGRDRSAGPSRAPRLRRRGDAVAGRADAAARPPAEPRRWAPRRLPRPCRRRRVARGQVLGGARRGRARPVCARPRGRDRRRARKRRRVAGAGEPVKALAVYPGTPNSLHLEEVPMPQLDEIPDGRGVLVKVLRVGVDGTDKEINAAEYGAAPPGDDFLIIGHENFGIVEEVGPNVPDTIVPGTYVVASVRRPGSSIYGQIGLQDFTTDDVYYERGINLLHGYLTEYYVEDARYVFPLPRTLEEVGVLLEPTTVAEKGINSAFEIQRRLKVWEPRRACILGSGTIGLLMALVARLRGLELTVFSLPQKPNRNAELVEQLGGHYVSSQEQSLAEVSEQRGPFDLIMDATGFSPIVWEAAEVLGKNVMVGTVNASPADFRSGVDDLIKAEALFPGWLSQLLTTPIRGLENYEEMIRALTEDRDAIKVFVEIATDAGA